MEAKCPIDTSEKKTTLESNQVVRKKVIGLSSQTACAAIASFLLTAMVAGRTGTALIAATKTHVVKWPRNHDQP